MTRRAALIAAIACALAAALWLYHVHRTQVSRDAVVALIRDAGERLRAGWPRATGEAGVDFDAHARIVDAHVATLRTMNAAAVRGLADAADDYLVSVREILRRQAAMHGARSRLAKDLESLAAHMRSDRGHAAWPQEAVRLKNGVESSLRDYRIATRSYASLLESFPASQSRVAEHLAGASLVDGKAVQAAGAHALDALARTDDNIRQITRLDAYRGSRANTRR